MQSWHLCYSIVLCLCRSLVTRRNQAYLQNNPAEKGHALLEAAGAALLCCRKFPLCLGVGDFLPTQRDAFKKLNVNSLFYSVTQQNKSAALSGATTNTALVWFLNKHSAFVSSWHQRGNRDWACTAFTAVSNEPGSIIQTKSSLPKPQSRLVYLCSSKSPWPALARRTGSLGWLVSLPHLLCKFPLGKNHLCRLPPCPKSSSQTPVSCTQLCNKNTRGRETASCQRKICKKEEINVEQLHYGFYE